MVLRDNKTRHQELCCASKRDVRHNSSIGLDLVLFCIGAVLIISTAAAQIVDTARISGVVRDSSGDRISSALVSFRSLATGSAFGLHSTSEGLYITPPLPPGDYELKVQAVGFSSL